MLFDDSAKLLFGDFHVFPMDWVDTKYDDPAEIEPAPQFNDCALGTIKLKALWSALAESNLSFSGVSRIRTELNIRGASAATTPSSPIPRFARTRFLTW